MSAENTDTEYIASMLYESIVQRYAQIEHLSSIEMTDVTIGRNEDLVQSMNELGLHTSRNSPSLKTLSSVRNGEYSFLGSNQPILGAQIDFDVAAIPFNNYNRIYNFVGRSLKLEPVIINIDTDMPIIGPSYICYSIETNEDERIVRASVIATVPDYLNSSSGVYREVYPFLYPSDVQH